MTPSVGEIRAQVAALLDRDVGAQVVAMHATRQGDWPTTISVTACDYRLAWCESPLAVRLALRNARVAQTNGLVILTPLAESDVGADVLARVCRARIFHVRQWESLRLAFRAKSIDGRLSAYGWIADVLVARAPTGGYSPASAGVLDIDTAWRALLQVTLGLDSARPDPEELLRWAAGTGAQDAWTRLSSELQTGIAAWISAGLGGLGDPILGAIGAGRCTDVVPLGLIAEILTIEDPPGADLAAAYARTERYTGGRRLDRRSAERWAAASKSVLRDMRDADPERWRVVLARADYILGELFLSEYARYSSMLPSGFEARLDRFAKGVQACLNSRDVSALEELERLADDVQRHALVLVSPVRLERVQMATRLIRWLMHAKSPANNLRAAVAEYATDGAFVDWARMRLLGGDQLAPLSVALDALFSEVLRTREDHNAAFARALKVWNEAPTAVPGAFAVEDVLDRVVAVLAEHAPVLLLVMDGLALYVFAELSADLARHSWETLEPESEPWTGVAIAALPTVTEVSRASLLAGRLTRGGQHAERSAFSQHSALARVTRPNTPRLFHKGELMQASSLASEVRAALSANGPRIVGAVYNAIDDQLDGSSQVQMRWTLDDLMAMSALLYEARAAGRLIVLTADHGHVIDRHTRQVTAEDGGDRWRTPTGPLLEGEIAIEGGRVLAPNGDARFVAPWSESVRYAARKNGYHGGVSLQEVLVPLYVLAPKGMSVPGWHSAELAHPEWWTGMVPEPRAQVIPVPRPARSLAPPQADLLLGEPPPANIEWIPAVLGSSTYRSQKILAARVAPPDDLVRRMLELLSARGGKLSRSALSSGLSLPTSRIAGFISAAQRVLNVDQTQVLTVDDRSGTVELNLQLLAAQFDVRIR